MYEMQGTSPGLAASKVSQSLGLPGADAPPARARNPR